MQSLVVLYVFVSIVTASIVECWNAERTVRHIEGHAH